MGGLLPIGYFNKTVYIGDQKAIKCVNLSGNESVAFEVFGSNDKYILGIQTVISNGAKSVVSRPIGDRCVTVKYIATSDTTRDIYVMPYGCFLRYRISNITYAPNPIEKVSVINMSDVPSDAVEIKATEFTPY